MDQKLERRNQVIGGIVRKKLGFVGCMAMAQAMALGAALDVEGAKQVLDAQWQQLRPASAKERNVLFQNVKALGGAGTSFQFQVSAVVRDYDAGYPANRYYGQTCVGTFENESYTLWTDGSKWHVDGRMTALNSKCQNNPSAGVSSVPVASLPGTPAGKGPMAAAPQPTRGVGGFVEGAYECWSGRQGNLMLNFTIRAGGQYVDSQGKAGTYSVNPANSRVTFHGGLLDGGIPADMTAVYYEPQGRPTLSIRGASGAEAVFCQKR